MPKLLVGQRYQVWPDAPHVVQAMQALGLGEQIFPVLGQCVDAKEACDQSRAEHAAPVHLASLPCSPIMRSTDPIVVTFQRKVQRCTSIGRLHWRIPITHELLLRSATKENAKTSNDE